MGIDVVAVAVELALAKMAETAKDIERHELLVAHLERLYRGADLFHHAGELMAEGGTNPGIGHQAAVKAEVRTTDTEPVNPHGRVVWVLDVRRGFLFGANPVRAAVVHCQYGNSLD